MELLRAEMDYLDQLEAEYDRWEAELTEAEVQLFLLRCELDSPVSFPNTVTALEEECDRIDREFGRIQT
jgi:hypothetical protein